MSFRIHKHTALVLLIVACQAVCLLGAIMVFSSKMRSSIRQTIHDQVLADNVQVAKQMTSLIRKMEISDIRENRDSWEQMQTSIRDIRLPNQGFVCLTDNTDGSLLCHPDLKTHPKLANGSESESTMVKPAMVKPAMIKPAMAKAKMMSGKPSSDPVSQGEEVTGKVVNYFGELQIIAAANIPEMGATVNVHQKAAGIEDNISQIMSPVMPIGLAISLGSLIFTSGLVLGVVRRYDNRLVTINDKLEQTVQDRTKTLRRTRDAIIYGLAKLAESRDTDTGDHLDRIRLYVTILGAQLGQTDSTFTRNHIETLALASSLHDIGKVGIPDAVLLKPGRFTPEEREVMERHAAIGGECLKAIGDQLGEDDFLQLAREIAYCHHEKWDGTGYPFQISGESIPLAARIVALADVYDALRSRRPYKDTMSHAKAKKIILEGCGNHFDPQIVNAFLDCEEQFIQVSERYNAATVDTEPSNEKVLLPSS